jgi:hypothetical protein
MRTRVDSVSVSSVLFTIALVCLIPTFWANVITDRDKVWLAKLDDGYRSAARTTSDLAVVCLAIIVIGLIVIWTGYRKRVRWTWAVMFIVVWVWAFPLLVMPFLGHSRSLTIPEWIYTAISYPGSARAYAEAVLLFLLMVAALVLPMKSLFLFREAQRPIQKLSPKLVGGTAVAILVVMIALSAWVRLSAYEIPAAEWLHGSNSRYHRPRPRTHVPNHEEPQRFVPRCLSDGACGRSTGRVV